MLKILTIVGARPQFIKAAAVSHAIRDNYSTIIAEDILHTGQHYDNNMSEQFFHELDIPQPKYNLGVGSGSHATQTAAIMKGVEEILLAESYNGVLVYGDTNSTLAGALAAAKLHIPVFHVEAGLRSFNKAMPEEINRIVTDQVSTLLFAPTQTAMQNLKNEGFTENQRIFSGDVMLDNVRHYTKRALSTLKPPLSKPFIFATIHRDFNTDNPRRLDNIIDALNSISERYNTDILFPVHPRTAVRLKNMPEIHLSDRIKTIEPLSYIETLNSLNNARLVLTDSGGLQKEAFFCGCPCVVLRPETEWVEIVDAGAAELGDADPKRIADAVEKLWNKKIPEPTQFGDGNAAKRIVESICTDRC